MQNIICYDGNGDHLEYLTQWDHDIMLVVDGAKTDPLPTFMYSNRSSKEALSVTPTVVDGRLYALIPNSLLQRCLPINVLLTYSYNSGATKTEYRFAVPVFPAARPNDYVYTQDEVRTWEDLNKRISAIENGGSAPGSAAVMQCITLVAENHNYGIKFYPEGTEEAPVVAVCGERDGEPVIIRNLQTPELEHDAVRKDYVDGLIETLRTVRAEDVVMPDGNRLSEFQSGVSKEYLQEKLDEFRADLEYEPITVTGISVKPNVAMIGATIENPMVSWTLSRDAVEQTVNGVAVEPAVRSHVVEGSYSATAPGGSQSIPVTVTDERGAVATKAAKMTWHNAVYYTSNWPGGTPTDAQLHAMSQKLQSGRGVTINAQAGAEEYVLYACPKRMGTPEFWANGFQGGFRCVGVWAHYNAQGYREDYATWISNSAGLNVTITVK